MALSMDSSWCEKIILLGKLLVVKDPSTLWSTARQDVIDGEMVLS